MRFESDDDQLAFDINNAGAQNTIYITDDESVNKLVLVITTNAENTKFTPGKLMPEEEAPDAAGSIIYLDLSQLKLTTEEFNKLECSAPNWQTKLYPPATICVTPLSDITLGDGPGDQIAININKLTLSTTPVTPAVNLTAHSYRVPPVTVFDNMYMPYDFGVVVQAAPQGHNDLHDAIECALSGGQYVCNSIAGYDDVANIISFVLKPGPHALLVEAGKNTEFTLSMVYAAAAPGYGALTTVKNAIKDITVTHGQNSDDWKITLVSDRENPCWILKPPEGKVIVGTDTKATVAFDINNIITDFQPGPTIITFSYKNIDGYNDGSYSMLLVKVPHAAIPLLALTPNPAYLDNNYKSAVTVRWETKDAGTLMLHPQGGNVSRQYKY